MAVLTVNGVGMEFGDVKIIENISFEVQPGERVGLVGANGSGKTTLIKAISGAYRPTSGNVSIQQGIKVGVLDQIPVYPRGMTVEMVLRTAFAELDTMKKRMGELERAMAADDGGGHVLREYGELSAAFEAGGGYDTEVELARVSNGLNIPPDMLAADFNRLSGGERTRINLGRMILTNVNLMLLDEPTNHLDIRSVEWLEGYLRTYKGAVLIISHDRYFLDQTVGKIVEIEEKTAKMWPGNYSEFVELKEEHLKMLQNQYKNAERKAKQLEDAARSVKDYAGKNAKLQRKARNIARRAERARNEMPHMVRVGKNIRATFGSARRPGEDILNVSELKKCFGERVLFSEVELEIKKDDRIALVGANGAGKTTLLKILLGEEGYDSGRIKWGVGVKNAYLPQIVRFSNERTTVCDLVGREFNMTEGAARNLLGRFNFTGEDVFKIVKDLSGGEKSRLRLCILMHGGVNLLILDEPTNHLDIRSREWIEEAIDEFDGTLLMVSHDRYFIEKFATRIWSVENGGIIDFEGSYAEFREYAERLETERTSEVAATVKEQAAEEAVPKPKKRTRETDAMRKRVPMLERDIERLEEHISELDVWIQESASDHVKLSEYLEEKRTVEKRLEKLIAEWTELVEALGE